ncbi:TAXI family TRAP transporter solute-binding subunit [Roseateles sp. UC29_93]|uniref:TAXI family TRAP transporter solute-binding subunit n=1 Tax=Roseateles sp. UC29_93 TaxID=3350177 RepID=UPI00366EA0B8
MSLWVLIVLATLCWAVSGGVRRALPPQRVVIQAGPPGGSFDNHAHRYAEHLRAHGLQAEVRNQNDSLRIIDKLDTSSTGVHIGFTAQRVDAARHPQVLSAGVVELQPLFLFLRREGSEPATLAGLKGRRLVMPLEGSATAQAAHDVLARYGVSAANATFSFRQMSEAVDALQRGEHEAGFFMLAPDNALVRKLAVDPGLQMFSLSDSRGIARNLDYLKPATLVRGAFDLQGPLPPRDVSLVGATVNVVVREDLHPAVLYALLQAMNEVHKGQTLVSDPGDYPRQTGAALPVHPLALEWAKSGTPWLYEHLPAAVAGVVDAYWGPVLVLVAVVSAFGTLTSLTGFIEAALLGIALRWLGWLQRRVDRGGRPGWGGRMLFRMVEPVILRQGQEQIARDRLERLRPHMSAG